MSPGALAATLVVAFAGGGLGAIAGPWFQHRFSRTMRQADRRAGPYDVLLRAAHDLMAATSAKPLRVDGVSLEEADRDYLAAVERFRRALSDSDAVSSAEIRALSKAFDTAVARWAGVSDHVRDDPRVSGVWDVDWAHDLMSAITAAQAAYDALRDQVQRETRG